MNRRRQDDPLAGFTDVTTIARGSTATVLGARDVTSGQRVALKLLEGGDGGRPDRTSFEREARALGAISRHPNVVTLHRAQLLADGRPLLVLELCDGSLADRLTEEGPLAVRTVVGVGVALCGALETAHRAGILHGDLKPHNVLVTRYGEVALADFGVAVLRRAATLPADGRRPTAASGLTVPHAAPEVLSGAPLTAAGDVYGLASTMFELLTGHAPFVPGGEEDPETVRQRVLTQPAPPIEGRRMPAALQDLLLRALAKDPADRPGTPLELAQLLRAIEQSAGWGATPCRVDEVDARLTPLEAGPVAARRGRAAAITGLPPLRLGAAPLDGAATGPVRGSAQGPMGVAPPTTAYAPPSGAPVELPPPTPTEPTVPDATTPSDPHAPPEATTPPEPPTPSPLWEDAPRGPLHETITFGRGSPSRPSSGPAAPAGRRRGGRLRRRREGDDPS